MLSRITRPWSAAKSVARYGGMYGLTCVVDFAFSVGSVPNLVNRILRPLDIPKDHKRAILACQVLGHDHLLWSGRRVPRLR